MNSLINVILIQVVLFLTQEQQIDLTVILEKNVHTAVWRRHSIFKF